MGPPFPFKVYPADLLKTCGVFYGRIFEQTENRLCETPEIPKRTANIDPPASIDGKTTLEDPAIQRTSRVLL